MGRNLVLGQYDAGNVVICNIGLGNRMVQIGVFDPGRQSAGWWASDKEARRVNRAAGATVSRVAGIGRAAWKVELRQDGRLNFREVTVRVGQRAFRVTVFAESASMAQLLRLARAVTRRLD